MSDAVLYRLWLSGWYIEEICVMFGLNEDAFERELRRYLRKVTQ